MITEDHEFFKFMDDVRKKICEVPQESLDDNHLVLLQALFKTTDYLQRQQERKEIQFKSYLLNMGGKAGLDQQELIESMNVIDDCISQELSKLDEAHDDFLADEINTIGKQWKKSNNTPFF